MKPRLILLVGLPRSGKSTWAARQNLPVVCRDVIRLQMHGTPFLAAAENEVSENEEKAVRNLIASGHRTLILDATHFMRKYIERWNTGEWDIELKIFDTPRSICIQRAKETQRADLIEVIEMMCEETDIPELRAAAEN